VALSPEPGKTTPQFEQNQRQHQGNDPRRRIELSAPEVTGTAGAKEELGMKMLINEPENAGGIEQKLPPPERMTHFVIDPSVSAVSLGAAPVEKGSVEQISTHLTLRSAGGSTCADRLYQSMLPEVAMVKALRPDSLSVVLKPDRETEIFVRVTVEDGKMQAYARCDRGDIEGLTAEWGLLQKSLATQGVNLGSLNSGLADSASNFSSNGGHRQPETPARIADDTLPPALQSRKTGVTKKIDLRGRNLNQLLESWA
jgi:hypothetical protein